MSNSPHESMTPHGPLEFANPPSLASLVGIGRKVASLARNNCSHTVSYSGEEVRVPIDNRYRFGFSAPDEGLGPVTLRLVDETRITNISNLMIQLSYDRDTYLAESSTDFTKSQEEMHCFLLSAATVKGLLPVDRSAIRAIVAGTSEILQGAGVGYYRAGATKALFISKVDDPQSLRLRQYEAREWAVRLEAYQEKIANL